ncbi:hypothetical protein BS47DRAFT_895999 [Hydnum rufescens UP504]|uniref:Uncharacterized protein n=1 Tax=Hydnum rufescens UP504 TaxID=1448309 RepID=A0A9P6AY17_9AGAM|nr:hypothetical protein BS47DRAFT_895999 [Hydnum rufescens UP504]
MGTSSIAHFMKRLERCERDIQAYGLSSRWMRIVQHNALRNDLAVLRPKPVWTLQTLVHELFHDRSPGDFTFTEHHDSILRQVLLSQQKSAATSSRIRPSISANASSQNPDWARSSSSIRGALAPLPLNGNTSTAVAGMDLDDDEMAQSSSVPAVSAPSLLPPRRIDPRDELKDQLIVYLTSTLPPLIEASLKAHQTGTQSSSPLHSSPRIIVIPA